MRDLLLERPGRDRHAVLDPGHAVDLVRVRAGDVDHHGRVDRLTRRQRHPGDTATCAPDLGHFGIEAERGAFRLGGALGVVRGELRVADVAGAREEHRAEAVVAVGLAECRVVRPLGRAERAQVVEREARRDPLGPPVLPRDAKRILLSAHRLQMTVRGGPHDQAAGLVECGEPALVGHAQVARPVVPIEERLVGQRRAVERRVMRPDDRARAAGRAVARRRQSVDVQRPPAALGQLERRARADDAGADHDRVVALAHVPPLVGAPALSYDLRSAAKRDPCGAI